MASLEDLKVELSDVDRSIIKIQKQVQNLLERQEKFQVRKSQLEQEISKRETNEFADQDHVCWSSQDFPWSEKLQNILKEVFGITGLRYMQLETINATMSNRDVILIMPTGGGKSLCYQAPAMLSSGITLVISPLISLIEDQIISLKSLGIHAVKLSASSTKEEVKVVHSDMVCKHPTVKLLYVTPEKISKSKRFMAQLEKCYKAGNLSRIAIDEVHCASQWGNDFRPDYKILGILKRQFSETPLLGLTATSTDKVTLDTKKILNAPFAIVLKTPLNRPNLYYQVRRKPNSQDAAIQEVVQIINTNFKTASGILYCFSCKDCENVSDSLRKHNVLSASYHARLNPEQRSKVHKHWLENRIHVICATVAFGMGIDKPDVKFVIHFSLSKSVENYYQESGRAGRDGEPALCLLYYGFADVFRQSTMVLTEQTGLENLEKMLEYCQNIDICRRAIIFSHFGDDWDRATCGGGCDVCCGAGGCEAQDVTDLCREIIHITQRASDANERLTGPMLVDATNGRGKYKTANKTLKSISSYNVQRIVIFMLRNQYLKEDFHFTPYTTISYLVPGPRSQTLTIKPARISLMRSDSDESCSMTLYKTFCDGWYSRVCAGGVKRQISLEEAGGCGAKKQKISVWENDAKATSSNAQSNSRSGGLVKQVVPQASAIVISDSD